MHLGSLGACHSVIWHQSVLPLWMVYILKTVQLKEEDEVESWKLAYWALNTWMPWKQGTLKTIVQDLVTATKYSAFQSNVKSVWHCNVWGGCIWIRCKRCDRHTYVISPKSFLQTGQQKHLNNAHILCAILRTYA